MWLSANLFVGVEGRSGSEGQQTSIKGSWYMAQFIGRRLREAHGEAQAGRFNAQILIRTGQDPDHFIRETEQNLLIRRDEHEVSCKRRIRNPAVMKCLIFKYPTYFNREIKTNI